MHKKRTYVFSSKDPGELNLAFYQKFDPGFIDTKAGTLWFIDQHRESFCEFVKNCNGLTEVLNDDYYHTLQAEIHFAFFHQCETLFALIFAAFQKLPHWLYLTTYETREIKRRVRQYIDRDFSEIGGRAITDARSFLNWGVYSGATVTQPPPGKTWDGALDNLDHFLCHVAERYLAGTEYNAYKHGIRMLRGKQEFKVYPRDNPDTPSLALESDNALTYLELRKDDERGQTVHQTVKFFKAKEDYAHIQMLAKLAESIKNTRIEKYGGSAKREIIAFFDLDREQLIELSEVTTWTLSL
jgi:hypothetical protein